MVINIKDPNMIFKIIKKIIKIIATSKLANIIFVPSHPKGLDAMILRKKPKKEIEVSKLQVTQTSP
jgi:hypothetical protein